MSRSRTPSSSIRGSACGAEDGRNPARPPRRACGNATQDWMPSRACGCAAARGRCARNGRCRARRHPVDVARHGSAARLPRLSRCMISPLEQVGDGGEADMRVRPHVEAVSRLEFHRPHLIEEDEGPDHVALRERQHAAHFEPSPRSRARGTMAISTGSGVGSAVATGSFAGCQLIARPPPSAASHDRGGLWRRKCSC